MSEQVIVTELLEQTVVNEFLNDLELVSALLPPQRRAELLEGFKQVLMHAYREGECSAYRAHRRVSK